MKINFSTLFQTSPASLKVKQYFLVPFQVIFSITGIIYYLFYQQHGFYISATATLSCTALAIISTFASLKQLSFIPYRLNANLSVGTYLLTLLVTAYETGGLISPAGFWLPSVILLAISLVGLLEVTAWSILTILGGGALIILEQHYPLEFQANYKRLPHYFILYSTISLTLITTSLIIIAEIIREIKQQMFQEWSSCVIIKLMRKNI